MTCAVLDLVCPSCHGELTTLATKLRCADCGRDYELLRNGMPLLITADVADEIARANLSVAKLSAELSEERTQLLGTRWFPVERDELRRELVAALETNIAATGLIGQMLPHATLEALARRLGSRKAALNESYEDVAQVLTWLVRDWSGDETFEQQIVTVERSLMESLASCNLDLEASTAVVLGAGGGRFARDLTALFRRVLGFELSLPMAAGHGAVWGEPLAYARISMRNTESSSRYLESMRLSTAVPGALGPVSPDRLTYAVADATEMPVASGTIDVVVAVYFTDVLPLETLLPEVRRVLKPGGVYLHFGPLGYHFANLSQQLAADDVRALFVRSGFRFEHESWVPLEAWTQRRGSLAAMHLRNWQFAARRLPDGEVADDAILVFAPGTVVTTVVTYGLDGEPQEVTTITGATGQTMEGSNGVLRVLQAIDGRRDVAAVANAVKAATGKSINRGDLGEILNALLEASVVRALDGKAESQSRNPWKSGGT